MTDAPALVRRLAPTDALAARLTFAAMARNTLHAAGEDLIVVGGTAVDTYVSGGLGTSEGLPAGWQQSLDIDTVVARATGPGSPSAAKAALEAAGWTPSLTGGSYRYAELPFALDIVGDELPRDYSMAHVVDVDLDVWEGTGLPAVRVAGPEDVLFDYLESGVDTRHPRDWARALAIAKALEGRLDLEYLRGKAAARLDGAFAGDLERLLAGEPLAT